MTIRIHPVLWLWGPVALMAGDLLCEFLVPEEFRPQFFSEEGPHEKFQALFMFAGLVYAARLFLAVEGVWLKLWFGIAALSCLYIAGEEISWGQTFFGWMTPEFWSEVNDQQETNLHNTSAWLDQKPKVLLQIGVLVGGIIIPALQRWKPSALPVRYAPIYPTWHVAVTAGFAAFVKIVDTFQDLLHPYTEWRLFWRSSEVLELYIYYFVLIYLIAMWKRFKPA